MLSVSNFRALKITESRCQIMPKCLSGSSQSNRNWSKVLCASGFKDKVSSQSTWALSQNTCWLCRRASADHVTARENPEQRVKKKKKKKQTSSNASTLLYPLKLTFCLYASFWWSMTGSWKNSSPTPPLHSIITQGEMSYSISGVHLRQLNSWRNSCPPHVHMQER